LASHPRVAVFLRFSSTSGGGKKMRVKRFKSTHLVLHGGKPGAPPARGGSSLPRQADKVLLGVRRNLRRRAAVVFLC
jgi:hypothetical protein